MLVFTAIVPPRAVLAELLDVVDRALAVPAAKPPEPRRGLLGRRRGKSAHHVGPVVVPYDAARSRARLGDLHLPVAKLGNLTTGDILTVTEALRQTLADLPRPTVTFAGGGALDSERGKDLWAQLEGDLSELSAIATPVRVSVPVFVAVNVYVTTSPTFDTAVGDADFTGPIETEGGA